ncbi:hypothetical protein [Pseudotabrizicola sp.]|uniref:hypothetical protein n=2 Tax=Pseudotabrizicola sp. TaxID=2939647 RepID=UPI00273160A4|nr:hypothetical protein [Pseudotabrizicola sp.]MDP2079352.1 hypothetical protein [Pseudotabrizicola sp.]
MMRNDRVTGMGERQFETIGAISFTVPVEVIEIDSFPRSCSHLHRTDFGVTGSSGATFRLT